MPPCQNDLFSQTVHRRKGRSKLNGAALAYLGTAPDIDGA